MLGFLDVTHTDSNVAVFAECLLMQNIRSDFRPEPYSKLAHSTRLLMFNNNNNSTNNSNNNNNNNKYLAFLI